MALDWEFFEDDIGIQYWRVWLDCVSIQVTKGFRRRYGFDVSFTTEGYCFDDMFDTLDAAKAAAMVFVINHMEKEIKILKEAVT